MLGVMVPMDAHVCACVYQPEIDAGCLLQLLFILLFESLSLNPELTYEAKLAAQSVPKVLLSLPPQL